MLSELLVHNLVCWIRAHSGLVPHFLDPENDVMEDLVDNWLNSSRNVHGWDLVPEVSDEFKGPPLQGNVGLLDDKVELPRAHFKVLEVDHIMPSPLVDVPELLFLRNVWISFDREIVFVKISKPLCAVVRHRRSISHRLHCSLSEMSLTLEGFSLVLVQELDRVELLGERIVEIGHDHEV